MFEFFEHLSAGRNEFLAGKVGRMDHSIALYTFSESEIKRYGLDLRVRQLPLRSSATTTQQIGTSRLSTILVALTFTILEAACRVAMLVCMVCDANTI